MSINRLYHALLFVLGGALTSTMVMAAGPITSQSGDTYIYDSTFKWCIADSSDTAIVDTTCVIVRINEDSTLTEAKLDAAGFTTTNIRSDDMGLGFYSLSVPDPAVAFDHLDSLESWNLIEYAFMNLKMQYFRTYDDARLEDQWSLSDEDLGFEIFPAWDLQAELAGNVEVIFLDSGCETSHQDLELVLGQSLSNHPYNQWDTDNALHGTATMSLVASKRNSVGMAGIAGNVSEDTGRYFYMFAIGSDPTTEDFLVGCEDIYQYVSQHPTKKYVVNLSIGIAATEIVTSEMNRVVDQLLSTGAVLVAASGNGILYNTESPTPTDVLPFPASHPEVIAVSGYDQEGDQIGQYATGDHVGQHHVDVLAPADHVLVANSYDTVGYFYQSGTSVAAPLVTGIVALMLSANPDLSGEEIQDILRDTATKLPAMGGAPFTKRYGYGRVNALGALVAAKYDAELVRGAISGTRTIPASSLPYQNAYLWSDVRVDSGATLTVAAGTDVLIPADADSLNLGSTSDVELIVKSGGTLVAAGGSSTRINMMSVPTSSNESKWFGLKGETGATLDLEYVTIKNAVYGIGLSSPDTASIEYCIFQNNLSSDIRAGGAGGHLALRVANSTFTIAGGTGITILDSSGGGVIQNNILNGDENTSNGIWVGETGSASPYLYANDISDVEMGKGVLIDGTSSVPRLVGNSVADSKYGIYVVGCDPVIGDSANNSSDNYLIDNSTAGLYVTGSGATPLVRNNQLDGNFNAVYCISSGNPNLGTAASKGKNTITDSGHYCVWNRTTGGGAPNIQACGNWWGSAGVPSCTNGSVTSCNPLGSAPASRFVQTEPTPQLPAMSLRAISPNPMNMTTRITLELGTDAAEVRLEIFDLQGRLVKCLVNGTLPSGQFQFDWDGKMSGGTSAPSGPYFIRASRNGQMVASQRVLLVR